MSNLGRPVELLSLVLYGVDFNARDLQFRLGIESWLYISDAVNRDNSCGISFEGNAGSFRL